MTKYPLWRYKMDSLDMRVLSCLLDDCRMSDRQVGQRVGLSGGAVRTRIEHLERDGVILRYVLKVEPPVLQRGVFFVAISGSETDEITKQIGLVGDAFLIVPCVGGITVCGIAVEGDVQEKIKLARELLRDMRVLAIFESDYRSDIPLSKTDLAVMGELLDDPRERVEQIASRTGLSSKTVTRSIERLRTNDSILFTILYDPPKTAPYIPHVILAGTSEDISDVARTLQDSLGGHYMQKPLLTPNQIVLFLHTESIYGLDELTRKVRDSDGVSSADLFIQKSILLPQEWVGQAMKEAMVVAGKTTPRAA